MMRSLIILSLLLLSSCTHTKLVISHPTVMGHIKGRDDNINGAAVTVRVRWDITPK